MEVRYFNFPRNISFSSPPRDFRFLGSVYVLPRAFKKLNRFLPEPQKTEPGLLQGHRHQFWVSSYWIENTLISVCNQKPDLWHEHADIKDVVFQCAGIVLAGINCFKVPLNCRKYKITTSDWSWNIYSLTLVFLPPVSDSVFSQECQRAYLGATKAINWPLGSQFFHKLFEFGLRRVTDSRDLRRWNISPHRKQQSAPHMLLIRLQLKFFVGNLSSEYFVFVE